MKMWVTKGNEKTFECDGNVCHHDCGGVSLICISVKYQVEYFKYIQYSCQLYLTNGIKFFLVWVIHNMYYGSIYRKMTSLSH